MNPRKLQTLSKGEAIELATRMRNKARNIRVSAAETTRKVVHGAVSTVAAFAVGYWMGGLRYEKKKMSAADIEANGDPTKLAGMDKDLVVGVVVSGLGIAGVGGKKVAPVLESAGFGTLAGWAYSRGDESGYDASSEAA